MSHLLYLYGFVPTDAPTPPESVPGIDGARVRLAELGGFAAAVSDLSGPDYAEGSIEARLKDLAWVAEHGARHETVVTWLSDNTTIVPARLLTVFSSDEALRTDAGRRATEIARQLVRFRDRREWDVKVSYDVDTLARNLGGFSDEIARVEAEIERAAPGRRYLLERKRDDLARTEAGEVARLLAHRLLHTLGTVAEDALELDLPGVREDPVVLNAALLVLVGREDELRRDAMNATADWSEKGIHAALTGPWAPYRFVGALADE